MCRAAIRPSAARIRSLAVPVLGVVAGGRVVCRLRDRLVSLAGGARRLPCRTHDLVGFYLQALWRSHFVSSIRFQEAVSGQRAEPAHRERRIAEHGVPRAANERPGTPDRRRAGSH